MGADADFVEPNNGAKPIVTPTVNTGFLMKGMPHGISHLSVYTNDVNLQQFHWIKINLKLPT